MPSATENVLLGVFGQLISWFENPANWPGATVSIERNTDTPVTIPAGGAIVIRDGKITNKEYVIGTRTVFYSRAVEVEIYVENAVASARDSAYDALSSAVGAAIESDTTVGGYAIGCLYDRDDQDIHPIDGSAGIKCAAVKVVFDYTSATPLS